MVNNGSLHIFRTMAGMSVNEMANEAGLSVEEYMQYEKNLKQPDDELINKFALILNIPESKLTDSFEDDEIFPLFRERGRRMPDLFNSYVCDDSNFDSLTMDEKALIYLYRNCTIKKGIIDLLMDAVAAKDDE